MVGQGRRKRDTHARGRRAGIRWWLGLGKTNSLKSWKWGGRAGQ
ncbi:C2H2-type domain-containing protein [Psidium guajava]|nr:C2H2-type domain-containing protein [Psidium guajava]